MVRGVLLGVLQQRDHRLLYVIQVGSAYEASTPFPRSPGHDGDGGSVLAPPEAVPAVSGEAGDGSSVTAWCTELCPSPGSSGAEILLKIQIERDLFGNYKHHSGLNESLFLIF